MCPDKELISAYYDGETDERWSLEIKTHVEDCRKCSGEYKSFNSISSILGSSVIPGEDDIKKRVYSSIERKKTVIDTEPYWKRHLEISFSALVAAAAVLAVVCAALVINIRQAGQAPTLVEEITPESEMRVQVLSFDDAAAYIFSDDSGFDVLITIPSSETLSLSGEPQLIREADYKRGQ